MDALHQDFLRAFANVKEWQTDKRKFEKPKFHPGMHLKASLEAFGPFRAYWCLPGEGYLQVLKQIYRAGNWKGAPYQAGSHWATKSVMHYRDPQRGNWFANEVFPTGEFSTDMMSLGKISPLIAALTDIGQCPAQARPLRKVVRGSDEVDARGWFLLRELEGVPLACHVLSMMECIPPGAGEKQFSTVRLYCEAREVFEDSMTGDVWSETNTPAHYTLISFESVHVDVVKPVPKDARTYYL